jgi:hypothetical protein
VKLWQNHAAANSPRRIDSRHEFVIGPLCDSNLASPKARLYYCMRCKWSFLVSGSKVAMRDEDGEPLADEESFRRFRTFEEGPCPVLEAFAALALAAMDESPLSFRRKYNESDDLAPRHFSAWLGRPRPLFRVFSRLREGLGR